MKMQIKRTLTRRGANKKGEARKTRIMREECLFSRNFKRVRLRTIKNERIVKCLFTTEVIQLQKIFLFLILSNLIKQFILLDKI